MSDISPPVSDPKNSTAYRAAKLAVIILSTLIVVALIALVAGAVMKLGRPRDSGVPVLTTFPPGSRIIGLDVRLGRLILRAATPDGEEVDIIDTQTGRLISRAQAPSAK